MKLERQGTMVEAEVREEKRQWIAGFEDGGRTHEPSNAGSLWKLETARKWILPGFFRRNTNLHTFILAL